MILKLLMMIVVFSIPVIAILSGTFLKFQKIKASKGLPPEEQQKLLDAVNQLSQENKALRERVENLETIVTSSDWLGTHFPPAIKPQEKTPSEEARQLARQILKGQPE